MSGNTDLLGGLQNQLMNKYAKEKGCDGYGIYLVLWTGQKCVINSRPEFPCSNKEELKRQLEKEVPESKKGQISIVVLSLVSS